MNMTMANLNIKVVLGSTREGRFGDKAAQWILELAKKKAGLDVELLDLRDYAMPFFSEAATPSSIKEPYKNEAVARWTKKIAEADGYIFATAEYNHAYPAVLKNAIDWVYRIGTISRSVLWRGAALAAPVPLSSCSRSPWSSRWRRCGMQSILWLRG